MARQRFSQRLGFSSRPAEIRIRESAPNHVRDALLQIAIEVGFGPNQLRTIICGVLRVAPNDDNWSEYPNIWREVHDLVRDAEWYRVYDIVEAIAEAARKNDREEMFEQAINQYFVEAGVGWQLVDGGIEVRGPEHFEAAINSVAAELDAASMSTAQTEFHEALLDLSRRPAPDVTGAVQHALAGLECVARDAVGEPNATLGAIIKKHPDLLPKPLDTAVEKIWGYASERARHIREGGAVERTEAELLVTVAAAAAAYIARQLAE
jgi:hypothetical protein